MYLIDSRTGTNVYLTAGVFANPFHKSDDRYFHHMFAFYLGVNKVCRQDVHLLNNEAHVFFPRGDQREVYGYVPTGC
ncbi:hypothetical protein DPMN_173960 [Dreissena polymorpha]|uniref:Uncharacterized protein n=1 Tax=Dreissena polymorpha TaxID=45954 RepID=A0A9D4E5J9_DREPO|nr:hypothetical protein DPMN_173960 [Dreissena polymorpha]